MVTTSYATESTSINQNHSEPLPENFKNNPTSFPDSPASLTNANWDFRPEYYELSPEQKESIFSIKTDRAAYTVGVMRIYSTGNSGSSSFSDLGHSWISITNYWGSNLNIGGISVADGKSVTLGTWGNLQHKGLWYNAEGYVQSKGTSWSQASSIQRPIRQIDLDIINKNISTHDGWNIVNNCSSFASDIWNSVSSDTEKVHAGIINTPGLLKESITKVGKSNTWTNYTVGRNVPYDYPTYMGYPPKQSMPIFN